MAVGIDIHPIYQTVTDWQKVANAVRYVWVKVSDGGAPYRKAMPDSHVNGAKRVGLPVGGYHYAQFSPSPETQADVFIAELKRLNAFGLVPMLDLEAPFSPNSIARTFGIRFCKRIAAKGYRPGVYMSDSFARGIRPDQWGIPGLVIWIARYGSKPAYGGRYDLHQYTSDGSVPGISGRVDMNESYTNNHLMEGDDSMSAADVEALKKYIDDKVGSLVWGYDIPDIIKPKDPETGKFPTMNASGFVQYGRRDTRALYDALPLLLELLDDEAKLTAVVETAVANVPSGDKDTIKAAFVEALREVLIVKETA